MNNLISFYAWSPIIICCLSIGWVIFYYKYALNNPKVLLALGLFLIAYFAINVYSSTLIAKAANCQQLDASVAKGCILFGHDISAGLYTFQVTPWFGILVVGLGILFISTGLVSLFGWLMILKTVGYLFAGLIVLAFLKGLLSGS